MRPLLCSSIEYKKSTVSSTKHFAKQKWLANKENLESPNQSAAIMSQSR